MPRVFRHLASKRRPAGKLIGKNEIAECVQLNSNRCNRDAPGTSSPLYETAAAVYVRAAPVWRRSRCDNILCF